MNPRTENVLEDDRWRLVDVLLEEELGGAAAVDARAPGASFEAGGAASVRSAGRAGSRGTARGTANGGARGAARAARAGRGLAAALVLLGVAIVAAVGWLQRVDDAAGDAVGGAAGGAADDATEVQDPSPREERFQPRGLDDLVPFLRDVTRIRVQALRVSRDAAEPGLPLRGAEAVTERAEALATLRGAWDLASTLRTAAPTARLELVGPRGRVLEAWFTEPADLRAGGLVLTPPVGFVELVWRLLADARAAGAATCRVARTGDELRALPATVQWLECGQVTLAELQQELPRLPALRSLRIHACGDAVAAVLAKVPSLEELTLLESWLGDAGVRSLAALPRLRRLEVFRDPRGLGLPSLRPLAQLRALALRTPMGRMLDDDVDPAWLRALGELSLDELQLAVPRLTPKTLDALGPVVTMPTLRRLAVVAAHGDVSTLALAVAATPIECLRLGGRSLTPEALARLRAMPALRELSLRGIPLVTSHAETLAGFRSLRWLDVQRTGLEEWQVEPLRAVVPGVRSGGYAFSHFEAAWEMTRAAVADGPAVAPQVGPPSPLRAGDQAVSIGRGPAVVVDGEALREWDGALIAGPSWSPY